jgi:hypothetical protein
LRQRNTACTSKCDFNGEKVFVDCAVMDVRWNWAGSKGHLPDYFNYLSPENDLCRSFHEENQG